jgi:RimJ/RimL family protein N-acetyltransferase
MTQPAFVKEGFIPPTWDFGDFSLRPLRLGDEVPWASYLSDLRVTQHTSIPDVDLETVARSVQRHIAEYSAATSCRWALASPDQGLIGTCGFSNWSFAHSHAELVYDLAPAYWRRGFTRRAVNTVLGWAFSTARFNRVHAFVMTSNEPSIALLERCGFAREGTLHHFRIARATPRDFHVYAILRNDFGGWVAPRLTPRCSGQYPGVRPGIAAELIRRWADEGLPSRLET